MKEYIIEVEIESPVESVWAALVDFESYSKWNPIVPAISGSFEVGNLLEHTLIKPNGKSASFSPKVLFVSPPNHSVLAKSIVHPKIAYLVHHFELESITKTKTSFRQRWQCSGFLMPLLWSKFIVRFENFRKANAGLKSYLENTS